MHDVLFRHQDALTHANLIGYAEALGLDHERFLHDLDAGLGEARVASDVESADLSRVSGTPPRPEQVCSVSRPTAWADCVGGPTRCRSFAVARTISTTSSCRLRAGTASRPPPASRVHPGRRTGPGHAPDLRAARECSSAVLLRRACNLLCSQNTAIAEPQERRPSATGWRWPGGYAVQRLDSRDPHERVGVVRQRALIHVGGREGAGKTTFIEAALANEHEHMIIAVRCRRDDSLSQPRESLGETDPELSRHLAAGACDAARYTFPPGDDAHDAFFMTSFMNNYSNAVVLEGDNPISHADLAVYIAPASGGRLLVRRKSDPIGSERPGVDDLEAILRQPGGLDLLLGRLIGGRMAEAGLRDPVLERLEALTELDRLRRTQKTRSKTRWAIADGYLGIEQAQLVVVNIRGEAERQQGEMLLAEVARVRKDQAVFDDVIGWRGSKVPITAVVANLTEPKDPGTKKALARVRRVIRSVV